MNDVVATLLWWIALQIAGLTVVPLGFRVLGWLPDRGYAFSKALGVLLVSYFFWLLNTLGFLHNSPGSILFSLSLVGGISIWSYRSRLKRDGLCLESWLRSNSRYVIFVESFFLLCFVGWAWVRANNPEITATEKPMDLAFIQAIGRSDLFPPHDPWLSGFSISYYYFGYLMTSCIATITGVGGTVAFNLGLSWQFAGTLLGGFGLVFNLIAAVRKSVPEIMGGWQTGMGVLGALLVGVMGNLEGFLEAIRISAFLPAGFWSWLDILDINTPAPAEATWPPRGGWWWWRASRVIHDRGLNGESLGLQPIDEFPFFSFLLGDMHPHVLALPFVLLALALALNWWLKQWDAKKPDDIGGWLECFVREADPVALIVYAVSLGALGFLNTWDFPFYLFIVVGAWVLATMRQQSQGEKAYLDTGYVVETVILVLGALLSTLLFIGRIIGGKDAGSLFASALILSLLAAGFSRMAKKRQQEIGLWSPGLIGRAILVGGGLFFTGIVAYLPFYLGFKSQAGGILPNVINPSRFVQFFVMFGPFLFILWLWLWAQAKSITVNWRIFLTVTGGLLFLLVLVTSVLGVMAALSPATQTWILQFANQVGGLEQAARLTVERRITNPWTSLILLSMIGIVVMIWDAFLRSRHGRTISDVNHEKIAHSANDAMAPFVLLLVLTAAILTLAPEFVYLKDNFGARLNTVFKFYYQAWVMWAVASAYALYILLQRSDLFKLAAAVGGFCLIGAGLLYPILSVPTRTNSLPYDPTLDGSAYMQSVQPADFAAISWLQENVAGSTTILEAVGGQYSWGGRISAHTGLPTVLGWAGHEYQWRGETPEPGIRENDVKTMYTSRLWPETRELLEKYQIEYVIVGPLEKSTYGETVSVKFDGALETVFQADGVAIYQWNELNPQ